jgi:2-polyprenyl-3-methyl-5-hydroxy-6-metoxy-1,4-benzoquinol methylase
MFFIRRLIQLYKKIEFEAGINEPIQIRTRNPLLALSLFLSNVHGRALFNKFTRPWYRYEVNERIVETPFLLQNLNLPAGSRILDFGCNRSNFCISLASLGYQVTGVDLLPYKYSHTNFQFRQGNLLDLAVEPESFDAITAVSAVEHSGLGFYGDTLDPDADHKVIKEFYRLIKNQGLLFITLPFGAPSRDNFTRIYDEAGISELLREFTLVKESYFLQNEAGTEWMPATKETIHHVTNIRKTRGTVACILCRKGF